MAESGYDKFLRDTSGMGPVPNAQGGGRGKRKRANARQKDTAHEFKPGKVLARNKPNKAPTPGMSKGG